MKPAPTVEADIQILIIHAPRGANVRIMQHKKAPKRPGTKPAPHRWAYAGALGALIVLTAHTGRATIVVAVQGQRSIMVAADSKITGDRGAPESSACKIRRMDARTLMAVAGLGEYRPARASGLLDVSLEKSALQAFAARGWGGLAAHDRVIAKTLNWIRSRPGAPRDPDRYATEVAYFRVTKVGVSKMRRIGFALPPGGKRIRPIGARNVQRVRFPNSFTPMGLGSCAAAIGGQIPAHPDLQPDEAINDLRQIVLKGIAAKSSECGEPITVIWLTAAGINWIDRGACLNE